MTCPPRPSDHAKSVLREWENKGESGRFLGAPFLARLYNFIVTLPLHIIQEHGESVFDFPMGFAMFLYTSHLEQEGSCEIENEQEAQVQREYEQALADIPPERRVA